MFIEPICFFKILAAFLHSIFVLKNFDQASNAKQATNLVTTIFHLKSKT